MTTTENLPGQASGRFCPRPHPAIVPVAAFSDNYIWLVQDPAGQQAFVVDPGDAAPVIAALRDRGLTLSAVLVTHHHPDHVGGLPALRAAFPSAIVYGPRNPSIAGIDRRLAAGDRAALAAFGADFEVLEVPGHTLDHIAFFTPRLASQAGTRDDRPVLFCGDTLFAAGCGRLFEGTPAQMLASLARLAALPGDTLVHCAHEYTLSNLSFARAVEPASAALAERQADAAARRAEGRPTVPSDIAAERATNPFLRWQEPSVRDAARQRLGHEAATDAEVFAALRSWKNDYRA
jgi:hydroxyacylglutathione hydrolase